MNFDPSSSLINPYNYSEPVTDPAHFAGRRNIPAKVGHFFNQKFEIQEKSTLSPSWQSQGRRIRELYFR